MCTLVVEECMQTQRRIVGRGKMDIEGVIEYEGRWFFSWEDSRLQSAERQLVRRHGKLWKMGSGKLEMRRSQIEGGSADGRRSQD